MSNKYDKILDAYRESDTGVSVSSLNNLTGAVTLAAGTNISLSVVGNTITINSTALSSVPWGSIIGTLSNQTDLQTALNAKQNILVNSAGLAAALSDETGTGVAVFNTSPTIVTPTFTTNFTSPIWKPASDSTTAIQITKADGTTGVIDIDTTNIRFGIFGTPTSKFEIFTSNTNTEYAKLTKNSGSGTAGGVAWLVTNDASKTAEFGVRGSTQAAYGALAANDCYVYTASNFMIMADSPGVIKFAAGGNTEIMRVTSTGLGIGMTPVKTLDVTGTFGLTGHATIEGVTSTGATGTGKFVFDTSPTFTTSIATSTDALFNMKNTIVFRDTTNGRPVIRVIPTGTLTTNPTNFEFFGTDFIADATNYERLILKSAGSSETNYVLTTNAGGTGTVRGLQLTTGSNAGLVINSGGHFVLEGVTSTGATGTGKFVFDTAPTISGNLTMSTSAPKILATNLVVTDASANSRGTLRVMPNGTVASVPAALQFFGTDFSADASNYEALSIFSKGSGDTSYIIRIEKGGTGTVRPLIIYTDPNTSQLVLATTGNIKMAGTAVRGTTEGTNHLDIFDGTAPAGTLANGISLYSTSGELRCMDASGNPTLLSPHDKNNNWIFDSYVGIGKEKKHLIVDMEKMVRFLNKHFGADWVHEYEIE